MDFVSGYGLAVLWMVAFLVFAWLTHKLFDTSCAAST
jgi:hypothetical protein